MFLKECNLTKSKSNLPYQISTSHKKDCFQHCVAESCFLFIFFLLLLFLLNVAFARKKFLCHQEKLIRFVLCVLGPSHSVQLCFAHRFRSIHQFEAYMYILVIKGEKNPKLFGFKKGH